MASLTGNLKVNPDIFRIIFFMRKASDLLTIILFDEEIWINYKQRDDDYYLGFSPE